MERAGSASGCPSTSRLIAGIPHLARLRRSHRFSMLSPSPFSPPLPSAVTAGFAVRVSEGVLPRG